MPGTCTWTLDPATGVWTVESNCTGGDVCVPMTSGTTTDGVDLAGKSVTVSVTQKGTFNPSKFGVRTKDLVRLLKSRAERLGKSHAHYGTLISHAKAVEAGGVAPVEVPCVAPGNVTASITLFESR